MNSNDEQPNRSPCNDSRTAETARESLPGSLEEELLEQKDRYLRLAADFDNFRRRTNQETDRRALAHKEAFIEEILPVIDNLDRALTVDANASFQQLRRGVEMIRRQLRKLLHEHGVDSEESLGEPFDPLRHEAIGSRRDPSKPDHTVLETAQPGFRRGKEIFRPAKVIVNDLNQ
jgi:molecular chaperone GrpE